MSNVKKEGDWFRDQHGQLFQTSDGKPPAASGTSIKLGDGNGGTSSGTWQNGQASGNRK